MRFCPVELRRLGYVCREITSDCCLKPLNLSSDVTEAWLIANNRDLWRSFKSFLQENPSWKLKKDPLDSYVEHCIEAEVNKSLQTSSNVSVTVYYSHKRYELNGKKSFLPFQRLAHESGLAWFHSTSHLSLHKVYGPWLGLRALVLISEDGKARLAGHKDTTTPKPYDVSSDYEERLEEMVNEAMRKWIEWRRWLEIRQFVSDFNSDWSKWEYPAEQAEYHYTKNTSLLDS